MITSPKRRIAAAARLAGPHRGFAEAAVLTAVLTAVFWTGSISLKQQADLGVVALRPDRLCRVRGPAVVPWSPPAFHTGPLALDRGVRAGLDQVGAGPRRCPGQATWSLPPPLPWRTTVRGPPASGGVFSRRLESAIGQVAACGRRESGLGVVRCAIVPSPPPNWPTITSDVGIDCREGQTVGQVDLSGVCPVGTVITTGDQPVRSRIQIGAEPLL